jgi:hypothetical protein
MPNTNSFIRAESFQFRKGTRARGRCAGRQQPTVKPRCEVKQEQRLWKICMETESPNFRTIEGIAFLFFGALAIAATVSSFSELFHLLVSGSVDHVVQALLPR